MDIFDRNPTYQLELVRKVASSDLIRHSVCALSARQLALLHPESRECVIAAEQHYGQSLALLKAQLAVEHHDPCLTLPASILLMSYELMSCPGVDYTRHFHGARSFIENLIDAHFPIWTDLTLRNSYTIFVRHDVDIAMATDSVAKLSASYLELFEQRNTFDVLDEVNLGNRALLTATRVLRVIKADDEFQDAAKALVQEVAEWDKLAKAVIRTWTSEDGSTWYPTSATAAALQAHLTNKLLLIAHFPSLFDKAEEEEQACARAVIQISLSEVSDAVQVRALQPLYQAAKRTKSKVLLKRTIEVLEDLERQTGFHTKTKVGQLKDLRNREFAVAL